MSQSNTTSRRTPKMVYDGYAAEDKEEKSYEEVKSGNVDKDNLSKKGKNFEKIAKSAAKKYGSEEAGKKVAGAVMYGKLNK